MESEIAVGASGGSDDVPSVDGVGVIDVGAGEYSGGGGVDVVFCCVASESACDDGDVIGTGDGDGQRFLCGDAAEGVGGRALEGCLD